MNTIPSFVLYTLVFLLLAALKWFFWRGGFVAFSESIITGCALAILSWWVVVGKGCRLLALSGWIAGVTTSLILCIQLHYVGDWMILFGGSCLPGIFFAPATLCCLSLIGFALRLNLVNVNVAQSHGCTLSCEISKRAAYSWLRPALLLVATVVASVGTLRYMQWYPEWIQGMNELTSLLLTNKDGLFLSGYIIVGTTLVILAASWLAFSKRSLLIRCMLLAASAILPGLILALIDTLGLNLGYCDWSWRGALHSLLSAMMLTTLLLIIRSAGYTLQVERKKGPSASGTIKVTGAYNEYYGKYG